MQLHLAEAEPLVGVKLTRTLEAVAEQVQNDEPPALRETGGLMMRCFYELAEQYPGIQADEANIDAIRMWMFKNPQDYSVLVAENMFGDIVSDLCAGLVGGLGFAPSANLGDKYAVFEPTHGSAPKYTGQHKVNPIAMLLTSKLMLDWLKETGRARASRKGHRPRHRRGQSADLRYGREEHHAGSRPSHSRLRQFLSWRDLRSGSLTLTPTADASRGNG
jgi:hypothetical protein